MLIIDCHCHNGPGDGFTGPWDTRAPLKDYMQWALQAGIRKTVLFAAFHSDYAVANKQVARTVANHPDKFYGFAFVHAIRDKGRIKKMVGTAVTEYGFVGIKAHRIDATISREICEAARLFGIPVLYDVYGDVASIDLFASEYPDVNFIIPHLGSFPDDWKAQSAIADQLIRHPNVYTDTSGVRRFDILKRTFDRVGSEKILFGSDGPWLHPGVELSKIKFLNLNVKDAANILSGNILKLISTVKANKLKNTFYESANPS